MTPAPAPPAPHRHDLDALRAAAMLLGVAYHAALAFALGAAWMVRDPSQSVALYYFETFVHGFRMPLFILLSGFFTALLWRRRGLRYLLRQRFLRVLLPCLLGLVTVVPATNWAVAYAMASASAQTRQEALAESADTSLWSAIRQGDSPALLRHLQVPGARDALHPTFGFTPLTWAALTGQTPLAAILLNQGANPNARNQDGNTALHAAAFLGRADVANLLLQHGADPLAPNPNGELPASSARADWTVVQYIADLLALNVDRHTVEVGRTQLHLPLPETSVQARPWDGLLTILQAPIFGVLWFLWMLCWLLAAFLPYALIARQFAWTTGAPRLLLSPSRMLWLIPLTMIPLAFMITDFGPDTPLGLLPLLPVFAYYLLFFFFGVLYYDTSDPTSRLGRSWRWSLPATILILFPLALECRTGTLGLRDALLPPSLHRPLGLALEALFTWLMLFGTLGLFRTLVSGQSPKLRYLSDASYWIYLAHLPLTILGQALLRHWPGPALLKWALLTATIIGFLLLVYDKAVRYTWLGHFLNGKRLRPTR